MPSDFRKQIEQLMDDVLNIAGNKIANIKVLAEIATVRKLTDHEFESMKNQVDLCKPLIKERFLKNLMQLSKEGGTA